MHRISKSMLGTYDVCPYKVKLWLTKVLPTNPVATQMERGKKIHDVFDKFYDVLDITNIQENATIDDVTKYFITVLKDLCKEQELQGVTADINNFATFNAQRFLEDKENFKPIVKELKIYDEKCDIVGVVDRIDKQNGKIRIIDYKSGYAGFTKSLTKFRLELSIYKYLIENELHIKIDEWGIYFSGDGTLLIEPVDDNYFILSATEKIEALKNAINTDTLPQTTNVVFCNSCEYFDHCWRGV